MRIIRLFVVSAALVAGSGAGAQNFTGTRTDCSGLALHMAKGVSLTPNHAYALRGPCRELETDDGKDLGLNWEAWVEVEARWDAKTGTFLESWSVKEVSGYSHSGTIQLVLKCTADPMLSTAKGCVVIQSDAKTKWPDVVGAWIASKPFTLGRFTQAQAEALSKQYASTSNPPPPAPKPKPKPVTIPSGVFAMVPTKDSTPSVSASAPVAPTVGKPNAPVPPPPLASGNGELSAVPLTASAVVRLQDGTSLVGRPVRGTLRWLLLGKRNEVLRTFPAGSTAYRISSGDIVVDWGRGRFDAGQERKRLTLPRRP